MASTNIGQINFTLDPVVKAELDKITTWADEAIDNIKKVSLEIDKEKFRKDINDLSAEINKTLGNGAGLASFGSSYISELRELFNSLSGANNMSQGMKDAGTQFKSISDNSKTVKDGIDGVSNSFKTMVEAAEKTFSAFNIRFLEMNNNIGKTTKSLQDMLQPLQTVLELVGKINSNGGGKTANNSTPLNQNMAAYYNDLAQIANLTTQLQQTQSKLSLAGVGSGNSAYDGVTNAISSLQSLKSELESGQHTANSYALEMSKIKNNVAQVSGEIKQLTSSASLNNQKQIMPDTRQYYVSLKQIVALQNTLKNQQQSWDDKGISKQSEGYQRLLKAISAAAKARQDLEDGNYTKGAFDKELAKIASEAEQVKSSLGGAGSAAETFGAKLKSAFSSQLSYMFGTAAVVQKTIQSIREMVGAAIELDSAMTQLKIVTNESDAAYEEYSATLSASAQKVGTSIADLTSSATVYARLGYNLEDSGALAELTAMLQNVGDIDVTSAQSAMTAIVKVFDLSTDQVESAMDKMVEVGNNAPISVSEIAEGMNNAASALHAAGNDFDQSVALLTAANTTVQDISKSSTGLRTIAARIRKTDTELNDLGEAMTEADYEKLVNALTDANVSLVDEQGELRSTFDILKDIAGVWQDLSANQRAALAETLAGTRQQNIFYSIIGQFQEADHAMKLMEGSAGALNKANETYMKSVQAHLKQFEAAWQGVSSRLFSASFLNFFVDLGTGAINATNSILDLVDALGGIGPILGAIASYFVASKFTGAIDAIIKSVSGLVTLIKGLSTGSIVGLVLAAAVLVSSFVITQINKVKKQYEGELKKLNDLRSEQEKLIGEGSEYQVLLDKQAEMLEQGKRLTAEEQARLDIIRAQSEALADQIEEQKKATFDAWIAQNSSNPSFWNHLFNKDSWHFEKSPDAFGINSWGFTLDPFAGDNALPKFERNLKNISEALGKLNGDYDANAKTAEDYRKELSKIITENKDLYEEYAQWKDMDNLPDDAKEFMEIYETAAEGYAKIAELSDASMSEIINDAKKAAQSYTILQDSLKDAQKALEEFNEAIKSDKGDVANSYADAYSKFAKALEEGKMGSTAIRAGIELFIPDEVQRAFNYDVEQLTSMLSGGVYKAVFGTEGDNYGFKFIDYIRSNFEELRDIVTYTDLGNGAFEFGYTSLSELASAMGVTQEAMAALLDSLNLYGVNVLHSQEETENFAARLESLALMGASTPEAISAIATEIANMDSSLSAFDIINWLDTLERAKYVDLSQVRNQLGEIVGDAIDSRDTVESLAETKADAEVGLDGYDTVEGLITALEEHLYKFDNIKVAAEATLNTYENHITTHTSDSGTSHSGVGGAFASGTKSAPGGKTMLNELGEEVVIEGNEAFVYGGGRPTVANLPKGAIVLNAEETAEAFDNRGKKKLVKSAATGTKLTNSVNSPYNTYYVKAKTKTCPNCRTGNLAESVRWCPSCGYDFTTGTVPVKAPTQTYIPPATTTTTTTGGGGGGGGGGSSSSSTKKEETWFERQYKDHRHARAMDKESEKAYLDWLKKAYQKAYDEGIISLDDYYKYQEEVYKGLHDLFKDSLSDKEFEIAALEKQGDQAAQIYNIYQQLIGDVNNEIQNAYSQGLTDNDDYVQQLYKLLWGYKEKADKIYADLADDAQDSLDDLIKYRMKMLKKELEDEKKSYNDRLSAFSDFINKQKDLLSDAAAEEDYLTEQAEKRKAVSDLEAQIAQLQYDDSASAQKKRLELEEQLTNARADLAKFERDYAIEQAQDQLDKIYEITENAVNQQTELIDEKLENQQYLYETALHDVQVNGQKLFEEMVAFEKRYGEGNEFPIVKMWEEAYVALGNYAKLYGQLYKGIDLQNVTGYNGTFTKPGGYATGTRSAAPGLHRLFEHGDEYIFKSSNGNSYHMFSGGEKVLDAGATDFIYNFARSRGFSSNLISGMGSSIRNISNSATNAPVIQMGDIIIHGSANESTVSEIRREQRSGIDYLLKEFKKLNK